MPAVPKIRPGDVSLAEKREQKRLARRNGSKGVIATARAKKARTVTAGERANKAVVRQRDRVCRWPDCDCGELAGFEWSRQEVAHLDDKGMGGDPTLLRSQPNAMIQLCRWQHQGPFGLHSGRAKVERLTPLGTDGPCEFYRRENEFKPWYSCGITEPPTVFDEAHC